MKRDILGDKITNASASMKCPNCENESIVTKDIEQTLKYGEGPSEAEIRVTVPLRHCLSCGLDFFDEEAERLKHNALCAHLGVLPPAEIKQIRSSHGMSRAEFSNVTGLGAASLARWERGSLVQSYANDRYLRLLQRMGNLEFLMRQYEIGGRLIESSTGEIAQKFPALQITEVIVSACKSFALRKAG